MAPSAAPVEAQKRRAALSLDQLSPADRATMQSLASAASIEPDLKLMLIAPTAVPPTRWPAPIADILLLPPFGPGGKEAGLRALREAGWLEPTQAPRVAVTVPPGPPASVVRDVRTAQAHGATALALCPATGPLRLTPESAAAISTAFSSRTLPIGK
jgi:hypothetical protein